MENRKKIYKGLSKIAFGYLLILININIAYLDILPDFAGYILFMSAMNDLKDELNGITMLKPLGIILTLGAVYSWISPIININIGFFTNIVSLILVIINIYFNFQLLTEISLLAEKYQSEETDISAKIIKRRNIYTILCVVLHLSTSVPFIIGLENELIVAVIAILGVISLIVAFMITYTLFSLRKLFREEEYLPTSDSSYSPEEAQYFEKTDEDDK